ncbi:MAG: hypothetical protein J2P37_04390, partial [Ktedonobacteraceae bacterium]|nr:hypothetical protein [Ktedonobacteraceae bacterium]
MQRPDAPVYAAIDIGSNTIHLVIARCFSTNLEILADEVELVRIGESVTATGSISDQKSNAAIATLLRYKDLAAQYSAQQVFTVATEAIRRANNNASFLSAVHAATGLEVPLISGDVEAALTFYGATYEHTSTSQYLGVMDLGGGSTELVLARDMQIAWHTSLPIGSGWLHDRYLCADPPIHEDMIVAQTFLSTYLRGALEKQSTPMLIATGGTANTLLYLARQAFGLQSEQRQLNTELLLRCEGLLCSQSAAEIADRYNLEIGRVKILPAGSLIIRSILERWQLDTIDISPHGIREGLLLAFMRYGEHWLQQVTLISQATADGKGSPSIVDGAYLSAPFVSVGRSMLHEHLEKMLEWR